VTQLFGSPALMRVLADHGARLPGVRRVTSAGAPVPADVVARMRALLPEDAQFWTPYGATECLPVAAIEGRELETTRAATEAGAGTCVGRPVPPNEVRVIRIEDDAIVDWNDALLVPVGEVGEITVAGPSTTDAYFHRDVQTRLAKIREGAQVVHRMGDLGYFDAQGRLWFCGRKSQRVETADGPLYTEQVEPVFAVHPAIRRAALVGVGPRGAQQAVLVYELERAAAGRARFDVPAEMRAIAAARPHASRIAAFMRFPKPLPVDIRHNAKIAREALAAWAARQPLRDRA
jgi:acyl-CoA synthetase (AMP-forming)/AMP-acid ligase II